MQRIPDPPRQPPSDQSQPPASNDGGQPHQAHFGFASTGRDRNPQSFEEIYGVPENFLECEVRNSLSCLLLHILTPFCLR